LILTGVSTDICILFSANDAYMRDYKLFIPRDCVAAVKSEDNERTLDYVERVLKADVRPSTEINFKEIV
jgi:nicotinamidase-related amidase